MKNDLKVDALMTSSKERHRSSSDVRLSKSSSTNYILDKQEIFLSMTKIDLGL